MTRTREFVVRIPSTLWYIHWMNIALMLVPDPMSTKTLEIKAWATIFSQRPMAKNILERTEMKELYRCPTWTHKSRWDQGHLIPPRKRLPDPKSESCTSNDKNGPSDTYDTTKDKFTKPPTTKINTKIEGPKRSNNAKKTGIIETFHQK